MTERIAAGCRVRVRQLSDFHLAFTHEASQVGAELWVTARANDGADALARTLVGHRAGEVVTVRSARRTIQYEVVEVRAPDQGPGQRPLAKSGTEAGVHELGGWIEPGGRFYASGYNEHLDVAAKLRASGDGPKDPWDVSDPWLLVKSHGEVLYSVYLTQPQMDTLGDMLVAAPDGRYRTNLGESIRKLRELETMPERRDVSRPSAASAGG